MLPTGGTQPRHRKMSIAFLSGDASSLGPMDPEPYDSHSRPMPSSTSGPLQTALRMSHRNPERHFTTPRSTLLAKLANSNDVDDMNSASYCHHVQKNNVMKNFGVEQYGYSLTSGDIFQLENAMTDTPEGNPSGNLRPDRSDNTQYRACNGHYAIILDSISSSKFSRSKNTYHGINSPPVSIPGHRNPTSSVATVGPPVRLVREARPSYNEEQRFFIMYKRIVERLSWAAIEDQFATLFNIRTKDGLTSAYYRIRRSWGMRDVTETDVFGLESDLQKVDQMASHFTRQFLEHVGYEGHDFHPDGLKGCLSKGESVKQA
jgi:hypothetical protein